MIRWNPVVGKFEDGAPWHVHFGNLSPSLGSSEDLGEAMRLAEVLWKLRQ